MIDKNETIVNKIKPLNKEYISVNFETRGKCPNCDTVVINGYFKVDAICPKCGIGLDWE